MFDDRLFETWPLVLMGACVFAGLFGIMSFLVEIHFVGLFDIRKSVAGLSGAAFFGYLAVATVIRHSGKSKPPYE